MLILSTVEEVIMSVNALCISPSCSCLMSCLRTNKSLRMGEFDRCHICIGLVRYLGFILGDLNEYFCDLRLYFSNYVCFGFFEF